MKKYLLVLACILQGILAYAHNKDTANKDTLNIRLILSSAGLFYGIELGDKPLNDLVDTLVGEIPYDDSSSRMNLVIITGKELGFTNQTHIRWRVILDSAKKKGYHLCPPQTAADLYVLSKNMPKGRNLINQKVANGKPIFMGMHRIRHNVGMQKKRFLFFTFTRKVYFDYVFCLKANSRKNAFILGYSATDSSSGSEKDYIWAYNDTFIFIN
jgi:hypothetical protein